MKKCVKILILEVLPDQFLHTTVREATKHFALEGSARILADKKVELLVCGKKDNIDSFIDLLHKELLKIKIYKIEIEPFIKTKDYRGVFRIIS